MACHTIQTLKLSGVVKRQENWKVVNTKLGKKSKAKDE